MAMQAGERRYTYRDCLTWPDDERWAIMGGEAYAMTPVPLSDQQASIRDEREKRLLYERYGVRKHAIVDPERLCVHRYLLG